MSRLGIITFGEFVPASPDEPIDLKTLSGLTQMVQEWEGEVVWIGVRNNVDPRTFRHTLNDGLALDVVCAPNLKAAIESSGADLLYAPHKISCMTVSESKIPYVLVAEFTPRERLDAQLRGAKGAIARARVTAGWARDEAKLRQLAHGARGMHCNGATAYRHYEGPETLLYFDSRSSNEDDELLTQRPVVQHPLTLAFSGRVIREKGADDALAAAKLARDAGVDLRLVFFGTGALVDELQQNAPDWVSFAGFVDFETQWRQAIASQVDVMLLPHRQSDPSCTYVEAGSLGVPTLGYANQAFTDLLSVTELGWAVPLEDTDALARKIVELAANRAEVEAKGREALRFSREHRGSEEMHRRMNDLARHRTGLALH